MATPPRVDSSLSCDGGRPWDAVIIGAGVAGSLAALALVRRLPWARIALLERCDWPRAKVCGCCLNHGALSTLDRYGLVDSIRQGGAAAVSAVEIRRGTRTARIALAPGVAIERALLDDLIVRAGRQGGVEFLPSSSARVLPADSGSPYRTIQVRQRGVSARLLARLVIAADGLAGSSLDLLPGLRRQIHSGSWIGLGTVLAAPDDLPRGVAIMHTGLRAYVGLVRLADGRAAMAAAIDPRLIRASAGPAEALRSIFLSCNAPPPADLSRSSIRGTPHLTHRRLRVAEPGLMVSGDAASYVEPFTGEGMAWAVQSAELAAELAAEHLSGRTSAEDLAAAWQHLHDRGARRRERFCSAVRACLHSPSAASAALRAVRVAPIRLALERFLTRTASTRATSTARLATSALEIAP